MRRHPSRPLALVLSAAVGLSTAVVATSATAAAAPVRVGSITPAPLPNLRNITSDYDATGLQCRSVPLFGGGTAAVSMLITSDSRRRVATAEYTYSLPYLNAAFPLGVGSVTVLRDTRLSNGTSTVSLRPRVQLQANDTCRYSTVGLVGSSEVLHHTRVQRPTAAAVQAWCKAQGWFVDMPEYCPTWLAA